MINSFIRLKDSMDTMNIIDDIDQLEFLIEKTQKSFYEAESQAEKVGIPGINLQNKRRAEKSLKIALDESATREERTAHWNNVVKIARKERIREDVIATMSDKMTLQIKTGTKHRKKELL